MRPDSFYQAQNIDLKLGADVNAIDVRSREVAVCTENLIHVDEVTESPKLVE